MNEATDKLESYLADLRSKGGKVPATRVKGAPHIQAISAASGVAYRFFSARPLAQRLTLACQEIGIVKGKTPTHGDAVFQQNCALMDSYVQSLEEQGLKLPEHPKHKGELFFEQISAESGVKCNALVLKNNGSSQGGYVYLREMVEAAASRIGMEVRIAQQPPELLITPLTYQLLLEQGTNERKQELNGKPNAD